MPERAEARWPPLLNGRVLVARGEDLIRHVEGLIWRLETTKRPSSGRSGGSGASSVVSSGREGDAARRLRWLGEREERVGGGRGLHGWVPLNGAADSALGRGLVCCRRCMTGVRRRLRLAGQTAT